MKRRITFLSTVFSLAWLAAASIAEGEPAVSEDDAKLIEDSAQESLEYDENLDSTKWLNPDTGNYGTITPTETYEADDGKYCREYHQTVTIGGVEQEAYGTACRVEDGSWQIARDEEEGPSDGVEVAKDEPSTIFYRDRVVYVPERRRVYGWPGPYPFALRVGFGLHGEHRHTHYGYRHDHRHRGHSRGLTVRRGHHWGLHHRHPHRRW